MTSTPKSGPLHSYQEFDLYMAGVTGRYLGGVLTAEELDRRFRSAGHDGQRADIFPVSRPGQEWRFDDGKSATFEVIVQGDLEFFCPDYTLGPSPEVVSHYDPGEYPESGLRQRIVDDWIPQLERNYGPGVVTVVEPDLDYLDRRSALAQDLADLHLHYLEGHIGGIDFASAVVLEFQDRRDAEDVHHHQFEAAIWDAGKLRGSVIDADRDQFAYDGRGPARRRLAAILDAFPELR